MVNFNFYKNCYGCRNCENVCPAQAIKMIENGMITDMKNDITFCKKPFKGPATTLVICSTSEMALVIISALFLLNSSS